ncbi:hypothetical protein RYX36_016758 [Vicia faba]
MGNCCSQGGDTPADNTAAADKGETNQENTNNNNDNEPSTNPITTPPPTSKPPATNTPPPAKPSKPAAMGPVLQRPMEDVRATYTIGKELGRGQFGVTHLYHPWTKEDGEAPDKPIDNAVLGRLKQFRAMNQFKKVALRVIAGCLSEEEIMGLKEMFKGMDTDNSGTITVEELKLGLQQQGTKLSEQEVQQLMEAADADGNGTIDYDEFITATMHMNRMNREEHLYTAFQYFDKDNSGFITTEELDQALREYNMHDGRDIKDILQEVDGDNDGRINYDEFAAMMRKGNPEAHTKKRRDSFVSVTQ